MGMYVNPGSQAFQNAVNSQIYIDKTGLLEKLNKAVCTEQKCICVSRPRRFGKSMAANMIRAYYSRGCDAQDLFSKYKIAQTADFKKYLNHFNVIHFDAAAFLNRAGDADQTVRLIDQTLFRGLKKEFPQIIDDRFYNTSGDIYHNTFSALIDIYEKTQMQFVIVIDEWDCLIREVMGHTALIDEYLRFLSMLFKSSESQDFLALGYMTGILPIKKFKGESALNNFCEYTMTEPAEFAEYFGFTQEETLMLCRQYQLDQTEIKRWYDGYCLGAYSHIYNPNSLVQAAIKRSISSYWKNTAAYENLNKYILCNFEGLKDIILDMLLGGQCRVNIDTFQNDLTEFSGQNDILAALIHLGYLTYHADTHMSCIPNEEVRMAFVASIRGGGWRDVAEALSHSQALLEATMQMDEEMVAREIQNSQMRYASIIEFHDENALSCAVMMAYFTARDYYTIIRELPSGKGFADLAFIPRPNVDQPAMMIELKWNQSAQAAIDQIWDRCYTGNLINYKENLLLVGINYNKKNKQYSCKIEKYK